MVRLMITGPAAKRWWPFVIGIVSGLVIGVWFTIKGAAQVWTACGPGLAIKEDGA